MSSKRKKNLNNNNIEDDDDDEEIDWCWGEKRKTLIYMSLSDGSGCNNKIKTLTSNAPRLVDEAETVSRKTKIDNKK